MDNERISREKMIALVIDSRYSIDDQIALLRQKDEKPEEWAAFNSFAEEVKRAVTAEYAALEEAKAKAAAEAEPETEPETEPELELETETETETAAETETETETEAETETETEESEPEGGGEDGTGD